MGSKGQREREGGREKVRKRRKDKRVKERGRRKRSVFQLKCTSSFFARLG